jgi:hypothetical protein
MAEDTLTPDGSDPADEPERRQPPDWARGLDEPADPDDDLDDDDLDDDGAGSDWPRFITGGTDEDSPSALVVPLHGASDPDDDLDDDELDDDPLDDDDGGAHLPLDASNMQRFEFDDLVDWGHWLIARWQLQERFAPCWPAHHDLRAEVLALRRDWALLEQGKIALSLWLHNLDLALSRIERLWRPPCTRSEHWPDEQPPLSGDWAAATARALYGVSPQPIATPRQDVATGIAVPLIERPEPPEHSA